MNPTITDQVRSSRRLAYKRIARFSGSTGLCLYFLVTVFFAHRFGPAPETRLIDGILLLAVFVIVPLGVSLIARDEGDDHFLFPAVVVLQPAGAVLVFLSFLLGTGILPAVLAFVWLVVTGLAALLGVSRLLRPELRNASELSIDAGLLFLPTGALWLIASRLDIQPLGFGETIVLLTAVHFHFAGFAAPILAGLAGRRLPAGRGLRRVHACAVACIIAGTPLVAAGITVSPVMALLGATIISVGLIVLAVLVCGWVVPTIPLRLAQVLLVISSLATLPAMLLACTYAYSIVSKKVIVDIPQMAMTHGIANAFGFALCGMLAWSLVDWARSGSAPTVASWGTLRR